MAFPPSCSSGSSERTPSPQLDEDPTCWGSNNKRRKAKSISEEIPDSTHSCSSSSLLPPPRKRTKSPGVRVVGGRIFDSENGKTCHQCRQKTMDFSVACKSRRDDKPCTMKYCHKCLFNRYAEKAEAVTQLEDWKCPKCRGICNCSHCIRKRGYQPIGSLLCTAKATGFHSVLEMLTVDGPEKIFANLKKEPLYLPSPTDVKDSKWIKLEDIYGAKEDDTQSMESTKFSLFNTEISPKVDTPGWEIRNVRRPKWKQLARDKGSQENATTRSVEILNTTSVDKEEKKISETDGEDERSLRNL